MKVKHAEVPAGCRGAMATLRWSFGRPVLVSIDVRRVVGGPSLNDLDWIVQMGVALRTDGLVDGRPSRDAAEPFDDSGATVQVGRYYRQLSHHDESGVWLRRPEGSALPKEGLAALGDRLARNMPGRRANYSTPGWVFRDADWQVWRTGGHGIGD